MSDWKNVQYKDGKMRTSEGGGGGGSSTFAGLDDVSFSDIQNGQVPKYNSDTGKWENADESGGGGNVDDVEVNGVSVVDAQKVAKITSYKEVTQAQYEALPDTKLSDNVLYAIKDGGKAVDGFPPLIYSDEEREVGVWRDGKPLYQKTVKVTTTLVSGDNDVPVSTPNLETLVDAWCTAKMGNGCWVQISTSNPTATWNLSIYDIDSTKVRFCVGSGIANRGLSEVYVTLQYTKTTDTPGSGTWNQQGALAHHYSTNEKVIGTWIDGKPIYEKVISPLTTTSGNYALDVSALHINEIIDFRLFIHNTTGGDYAFGPYWESGSDKLNWYFHSSKNTINIRSNQSYSYGTGWCIIQYTKTTD